MRTKIKPDSLRSFFNFAQRLHFFQLQLTDKESKKGHLFSQRGEESRSVEASSSVLSRDGEREENSFQKIDPFIFSRVIMGDWSSYSLFSVDGISKLTRSCLMPGRCCCYKNAVVNGHVCTWSSQAKK